jgi:hypothetical protein
MTRKKYSEDTYFDFEYGSDSSSDGSEDINYEEELYIHHITDLQEYMYNQDDDMFEWINNKIQPSRMYDVLFDDCYNRIAAQGLLCQELFDYEIQYWKQNGNHPLFYHVKNMLNILDIVPSREKIFSTTLVLIKIRNQTRFNRINAKLL